MKKPSSTITSEKTFKYWICWLLEETSFHTTMHERTQNALGVPDVSFGIRGINGWIEFKWNTGKTRAGQVNWMNKRAATGGHCYVCRGFPDKLELLDWQTKELWTVPRSDWEFQLPNLLRYPPPNRAVPAG